MTEEEYFRKTYPDYCYGDRLLSPYWDFFQDGVEFGERQSENKTADIKANCDLAIEGRDIKIKELEQEIEKHKWNDIFLEDCADYDKEIAKEYTTLQKRIADLEKENEELAEERAERYGIDLCCYCRECDEGKTKPCQHKKDAMHGYKDGFLAGLKAGRPQWHYVKDGDFPTDKTEKEYLVALKSEYIDFFYETDIWCESLHCFASNNPKKVYAWKEIVPPKEIE